MKNILLTIAFIFLVISVVSNAQDITNTLAPNGNFKVKDGAADYLSLNQSTGNLSLFRNLELGGLLNSTSSIGVITKGGSRFIHNYQGEGTQGKNTFVGLDAGNFTMGRIYSDFEGSFNTGIGYSSLFSNTTGAYNTANGFNALYSNTTGDNNTANGVYALYSNTTGYGNTANGVQALNFNTTGNYNTANGVQALFSNTTGNNNTANGFNALCLNTTGIFNTANGVQALFYNTTGGSNTATGFLSLYSNTTSNYNSAYGVYSLFTNTTGYANSAFGYRALEKSNGIGNTAVGSEVLLNMTSGDQNTAIGYFAGSNITTGINNITIGYDAQVPNNAGSNQVRIGNTSINYAGIQVAWTITSDRRWKENIQPSNLGLGFITRLNPVSYTRKNDENHRTEYGLIAQELEEVLKKEGIENAGMLTITDEGYYELRYNDLLAPMIKAIQELAIKNEELKIEKDKEITRLSAENLKLKSDLESLMSIKEKLTEIELLKEELMQQISELKSVQKEYESKFSSLEN